MPNAGSGPAPARSYPQQAGYSQPDQGYTPQQQQRTGSAPQARPSDSWGTSTAPAAAAAAAPAGAAAGGYNSSFSGSASQTGQPSGSAAGAHHHPIHIISIMYMLACEDSCPC